MAIVINMPRLSDTMEEGTVAAWLKNIGDTIVEGDILAEIETDKATMEFESFYNGTLLHIGIAKGETAKVDDLLAIIGEAGEDISGLINGSKTKEEVVKIEETSASESIDVSKPEKEIKELPDGVQIITMPRLSDTMEEGTVATWLKKEGDLIKEGDILAEIETDKATMEFESFYSGSLLKIGISKGQTAKVDALLAIIGPKGTDVSWILENYAKDTKARTTQVENKEIKSISDTVESPSKPLISEPIQVNAGSSVKTDTGRIFVSPLAKKMAEDRKINLSHVRGSGENGRIIKYDIENFKNTGICNLEYVPSGEEAFDEVPNSQMRKTIAKRLGESKFSAPHYYLTVEMDMDHAIAARTAINMDPDVKISFNDMIVKACAMALRKHPKVNSQWTNDAIRIAKHIHVGVAVAVDDGLLVPVLKFADQMTFSQIGESVKQLAEKARSKKIAPQEMEGSTFTVSNLGMFGIREFTSIINAPNSAILSVGAIIEKPVVKKGVIAVGNTMVVTLACDHRTVDGATGAQFLQTLKQYVENPVTMFV